MLRLCGVSWLSDVVFPFIVVVMKVYKAKSIAKVQKYIGSLQRSF